MIFSNNQLLINVIYVHMQTQIYVKRKLEFKITELC